MRLLKGPASLQAKDKFHTILNAVCFVHNSVYKPAYYSGWRWSQAVANAVKTPCTLYSILCHPYAVKLCTMRPEQVTCSECMVHQPESMLANGLMGEWKIEQYEMNLLPAMLFHLLDDCAVQLQVFYFCCYKLNNREGSMLLSF
jgi:hypothetical protein